MSDKLQDAREAFEQYRLRHNKRPIKQSFVLGAFRVKSTEPTRWYLGPSLEELAAGCGYGLILQDGPFPQPLPAVEKVSGPAVKMEEGKPVFNFLKDEYELDVYLIEFKEASGRVVLREVSPRCKADLFREVYAFTRTLTAEPIQGRSATCWLDTRQRTDAGRVFIQVLDAEPVDGYHIGGLRSFTLAELPDGLREPDDWQARENLRIGKRLYLANLRERQTITPAERHEDVKSSRAAATREAEIAAGVEKALKERAEATV